MTTRILVGDALTVLRTLPSESVHMAVCSPPYFGLRDYGTAQWDGGAAECDHLGPPMRTNNKPSDPSATFHGGTSRANEPMGRTCFRCGAVRADKQMGQEATPELWVAAMVAVFAEVRRVLRADGTAWINCGDSYAGSGKGPTGFNGIQNAERRQGFAGIPDQRPRRSELPPGFNGEAKPKDLIGIPWMLAFALRADGWYLRSEIIWSKPNPMPESVTDRPTKAHEQLFLLSKSRTYYYDADAIKEADAGLNGGSQLARLAGDGRYTTDQFKRAAERGSGDRSLQSTPYTGLRNKRSVWTVATEPFPGSHFATYPTALIEPCIKAGTSERGCCPECGAPWVRQTERTRYAGTVNTPKTAARIAAGFHGKGTGLHETGWQQQPEPTSITLGWRPSCKHEGEPVPATVLDCFFGAGTTGLVADRLNRDCIGVELNEQYAAMAQRRISGESPMFSDVEVA